jgi:hypothetical protein
MSFFTLKTTTDGTENSREKEENKVFAVGDDSRCTFKTIMEIIMSLI